MNTNFSLGNQRVAELKAQKNMYMHYLKKQQMIINALQQNAFRQHSSVPTSAPAPAVVVPNIQHHHEIPKKLDNVHKNKGFNALLANMNKAKNK
jgi:hypothetical protein